MCGQVIPVILHGIVSPEWRVQGGDQNDVPHVVRALREHRDRALERHFVPFVVLIGGTVFELFTSDINRPGI